MGSPKALLELSGRTFVARIVAALWDGGCDQVVVVVGSEKLAGAERLRLEADKAGALIAVNPDPLSEQVDSIRCGLNALAEPPDAMVMTPVDAPLVEPTLVQALIAAHQKGAVIAVPQFEGRRGHPILFSDRVLPEFFADLPEGARTILHRHRKKVVEIPATSTSVLLDIDTPEEYKRLQESVE